MDLKDVNDQLVTLTATTEALKTSATETGRKIDTVQTTVNDIKNLLAPKPAPVTAPAAVQPAGKITIAERLHGLIEIFYGLAIASGLQFVSTYIFAPDFSKGDYPIGSPMWYVMLWAVGVALLTSLSDWFDSAQNHQEYNRPMLVVYDLAFTLALFFLFVGAFRFEIFLGAVAAYSVVAVGYFVLVSTVAHRWMKMAGYVLIFGACGGSVWSNHGRFQPDSSALIPEILIPGSLITVLLLVTMVVRWKQLRKVIQERR